MLGNTVTMLLAALTLAAPAAFAHGPWRAGASNTGGWRLMSLQERLQYQARIRRSDTYEECLRYEQEHESAMRERAWRRGQAWPPREQDACAGRQAKPVRH